MKNNTKIATTLFLHLLTFSCTCSPLGRLLHKTSKRYFNLPQNLFSRRLRQFHSFPKNRRLFKHSPFMYAPYRSFSYPSTSISDALNDDLSKNTGYKTLFSTPHSLKKYVADTNYLAAMSLWFMTIQSHLLVLRSNIGFIFNIFENGHFISAFRNFRNFLDREDKGFYEELFKKIIDEKIDSRKDVIASTINSLRQYDSGFGEAYDLYHLIDHKYLSSKKPITETVTDYLTNNINKIEYIELVKPTYSVLNSISEDIVKIHSNFSKIESHISIYMPMIRKELPPIIKRAERLGLIASDDPLFGKYAMQLK